MNAKIICILIVAMFLFGNSYAGSWNKDDYRINTFDKRQTFIEMILQKLFYRIGLLLLNMDAKPSVDSEVKIYDGRQYAQAFYPYFENLTKIELPIRVVKTFGFGEESSSKNIKRIGASKSSSRAGIVKTTSYSEHTATPSNSPWKLGDLIVRICENESGMPGKSFSREEIRL